MDPCHLKPVSDLAFEVNIGKSKLSAFLPEIGNFNMLRGCLVRSVRIRALKLNTPISARLEGFVGTLHRR
jgi:hypothetical protein